MTCHRADSAGHVEGSAGTMAQAACRPSVTPVLDRQAGAVAQGAASPRIVLCSEAATVPRNLCEPLVKEI